MCFKKISLILILPILSNILLSNELEKNKILNIMVNHNYDLTDQKYATLKHFFFFCTEEIKSAMVRIKKLLKKYLSSKDILISIGRMDVENELLLLMQCIQEWIKAYELFYGSSSILSPKLMKNGRFLNTIRLFQFE